MFSEVTHVDERRGSVFETSAEALSNKGSQFQIMLLQRGREDKEKRRKEEAEGRTTKKETERKEKQAGQETKESKQEIRQEVKERK